MRGILVDPLKESVTEIQFENKLEELYKILDVDCIDIVHFPDGSASLVVDDEGLLKDPIILTQFRDFPQPLAGKILVVNEVDTEEGKDLGDCKLSVENIKERSCFLHLAKPVAIKPFGAEYQPK